MRVASRDLLGGGLPPVERLLARDRVYRRRRCWARYAPVDASLPTNGADTRGGAATGRDHYGRRCDTLLHRCGGEPIRRHHRVRHQHRMSDHRRASSSSGRSSSISGAHLSGPTAAAERQMTDESDRGRRVSPPVLLDCQSSFVPSDEWSASARSAGARAGTRLSPVYD
jgi:hypothetical protein